MTFPLYNGLSDDFDRHDGSLSPYVNSSNLPLPYEKHYDLRMFHTTNLTVPWTLNDNTWWTGYRYTNFGIPQIGNPRSIVNATSRGRTQFELDLLNQTALDAMTQSQIENVQTGGGNEGWPSTDANVTVGKDSAYRYSNTIRVALDGSTNRISNPGFETNTVGWTPFSDGSLPTLTRVTTQFHGGVASCQVVANSVTGRSTAYATFSGTFNAGDVITASIWIKGTGSSIGKTGVLVVDSGSSDSGLGSVTLTSSFQQMTATFVMAAAASTIYMEAGIQNTVNGDTVFIDDASLLYTTKTVNSYYPDDIATDFNEQSVTYFLELTLRSLPAQAAATHLDLTNSYIDVSSDINFKPQYTDSFKFSDNTNSLTSGGDTFARWARSNMVHADASNLKAIRFRLTPIGSGSMTFIAQAMRIVPSLWPNSLIGLDTKRKTLDRQIPRAGGTESSSVFGDMYFSQTRPKNLTTYTQFNSGHLPATGSDDNTFRQYYRYDVTTGNRIEVRIVSRSTQTRLFIDQKVGGVTTNLFSSAINTNIFTAETDYYLVTTLNGSAVTATVYGSNGLSLGSQVGTLTSGTITVPLTGRGYVGMSYEPYYYDFAIYSFGTNVANFGQFVSSTFSSRNVVKGATLYPRTSPQDNLLINGNIEAFADATATTTDGNTYQVVRAKTANQGGVRYNNAVYIGDSSQVTITGKIQPMGSVNGTYRVGLIDENDSVAWIYNLSGLLPNQYNEFEILLPAGLFPSQYFLHIQQSGSTSDTFFVRDIAMNANTIGWEASVDAGTTYQPFLNALNDRWSAVKFGTPASWTNLIPNGGFETDASTYVGTTGYMAITQTSTVAKFGSKSGQVSANNFGTNGDFETNITGWNPNNGAALSRTTSQSHLGVASLQTVTTAAAFDGPVGPNSTVFGNNPYQVSMWVKAPGGMTIYYGAFEFNSGGGGLAGLSTTTTATGNWQYVSVNQNSPPATLDHVRPMCLNSAGGIVTYYIDDVRVAVTTPGGTYIAPGGDTGAMQDGMVAGGTYTFSGWIYVRSDSGEALNNFGFQIWDHTVAGGYTNTQSAAPVAYDTWTYLTVTRTLSAAANEAFVRVFDSNVPNTQAVYYVDGLQLETGSVAHPYVNTVGNAMSGSPVNIGIYGGANNNLKLRATALSDQAYIAGYNLVPRYNN